MQICNLQMKYDTIGFIGLAYRPGTKSPHLVTQRINHRYPFLLSHRKTYFSPEETSCYLICIIPDEIQDFLWLLKYWGRGSFREMQPQSTKKNWDVADTSAGAVHKDVISSASTNPDD